MENLGWSITRICTRNSTSGHAVYITRKGYLLLWSECSDQADQTFRMEAESEGGDGPFKNTAVG
jgi:hypothetical protein